MNVPSYPDFWLDHLFVIAFAVVFPVVGFINYRKEIENLISGATSRRHAYSRTMIIQWALALIGVALWQVQGRDWADLGISLSVNGRFMMAATAVTLIIAVFLTQLFAVLRARPDTIEKLSGEIQSLEPMLPHSPAELRAFYRLSLTAGIVEELLWRGFLIAYLSHYLPIWVAALVSALAFGIGHAYQGIANTPKVFLIGLIFSGLFLLSGSLLLPMILHVLMDAIQGRTVFELLRIRNKQ